MLAGEGAKIHIASFKPHMIPYELCTIKIPILKKINWNVGMLNLLHKII